MNIEKAGEAFQKHWINGLVGAAALTALGFQVPPFHSQVHPREGTDALRVIEQRVAALEFDNRLLRAQLDIMVRGEVNFLGSRSLMRSMPLVGVGLESPADSLMEEGEGGQ